MFNQLFNATVSILCLLLRQNLFCQEKSFSISLEYSPSYSKITNPVIVDTKAKLSHNAKYEALT